MADKRKLQAELDIDTANANRKLTEVGKTATKALSPDDKALAKINQQLSASQNNFKSLLTSQQTFLAKGNEGAAAAAKVTQEMAAQVAQTRKLTTDQQDKNILLQKEVELRQQAKNIAASTKSAAQEKLAGPSASSVKSAESSGGGLSSLAGAIGPLAALGTAAAGLAKVFNDMGEKAKNTASIISDSGGKYDQLTQAVLKHKQAEDRLQTTRCLPAFAKFKTDLETVGLDILKGAIDKFAQVVNSLPIVGKSQEQQDAEAKKQIDAEKARTTKLKGQAGVDYENIKHDRVSMEKEIAMSEQQFAVETQRKKRDLALRNGQIRD
jgi:hypothetical protein